MSPKPEKEKELPTGWTKQWSRSQKRYFYFHENTKTSIWHFPTSKEARDPIKAKELADWKTKQENQGKKRNSTNAMTSKSSNQIELTSKKSKKSVIDAPNVAIIVPFRDIHKDQKRAHHLKLFVPHMKQFLDKQIANRRISDYHIYIIEQSNDNRKFNRGKLLNIGFDYAKKSNVLHDVFIFHDVDLLPGDDLGIWYSRFPKTPLHIARVWSRYSNNPKYFGGIVSFSASDMKRINGYPNTFWGWGGEDDEMQKRCERLRIKWDYPPKGTIRDLEEMDISQKINFLRSHKAWKCQVKWEALKEHDTTWETNGISDLVYSLISKTSIDVKATKATVDIKLNGAHWSNDKCAIDFVADWAKK